MIVEYSWSFEELRQKKCWGCKHLELYDGWNGKCTVAEDRYNKKLIRDRDVKSKACSRKINIPGYKGENII